MENTVKTVAKLREEFLADLRRERKAQAQALKTAEARTKESEARVKEILAASDAQMKAIAESYRKEREERLAYEEQSRREWAEIRKEWRGITGEWGGFTNGEGRMLEDEGAASILKLPEIGGMTVTGYSPSVSMGRKHRQYDGVITCENALVLVEFKRHFTLARARKFVKEQLPDFLRDYPSIWGGNSRAIYGAIAGATVDKDAQKYAEEKGVFVIRTMAKRKAEILHDSARPMSAKKSAKKKREGK